MRGILLAAAGVVVACSGGSRSGSASTADAGDAGVTCLPGTLALGGPLAQTPHGTYALSSAALTSSGFSASLPAGGSVSLEWSGDATSGPVSVDGTLVIPVEDATQTWCVSGASTVQVSGGRGILQLQLATGGDVVVEPNGACAQVDDAGMQIPVTTETATACFATAS
jgi:hypothetical protein